MLRFFAVVIVVALIGTGFGVSTGFGISSAQAQNAKGCSVEKCVAGCTQKGGRTCDRYCQNEMARRGCR